MILILSATDDPVTRHFRKWLDRNDKEYVYLPQDEFLNTWSVKWKFNGRAKILIKFGNSEYDIDNFTGVYARLSAPLNKESKIEVERYQFLKAMLARLPRLECDFGKIQGKK